MAVTIQASPFGGINSARITAGSMFLPLPSNNWRGVRVVLRGSLADPGVNFSGQPTMFLGFCSSTGQPYDPITPAAHAAGLSGLAWSTYTAGTRILMTTARTVQNPTLGTSSSASLGSAYLRFGGTYRLLFSVDLLRDAIGGASTGGAMGGFFPSATAADISGSQIRLIEGSVAGTYPLVFGTATFTSAVQSAVNETTYGNLAYAQFFWGPTQPFNVDTFSIFRIA